MPYQLKYEHPQFPADYEFGISGLGRVVNGGTLDVDEEMEQTFVASRGMSFEDAFKDSDEFTLSGSTSLSPDVLKQLLPAPEVEETSATPVQEVVNDAPVEHVADEAVIT